MKLVLGFLLGFSLATAFSYAQSSGTWFDLETGNLGTYNSQGGSTYFQDAAGRNHGFIQVQPQPFQKSPC